MIITAFRAIETRQDLECLKDQNGALAVWFTGPDCRVCKDLKPKLADIFYRHFPLIDLAEVDCMGLPAVAAQHQVFSVPTLLLFFEGRETLRLVRNFSLQDLRNRLQRSYDLFFL